MLKKKTFLLCAAIVTLLICSFMVGSVSARQGVIPGRSPSLGQQPLPAETTAPYGFPRAWGSLNTVTSGTSGFTYFFVASDGTVRVADVNAGTIVAILVIPPR
jgi:hypothetical protein